MTIAERNNKLKHLITCLKCEVSGKSCDVNCPTQYDAGNMGEIIENLEVISKALEQEPSGDLISREYLFKVLDDFCGHDRTATITLDTLADLVYDMPSVNPQEPPTGHWIKSNIPNEEHVCSECGGACWYYDYQANVAKSRFCPNCGCRMESEDKE